MISSRNFDSIVYQFLQLTSSVVVTFADASRPASFSSKIVTASSDFWRQRHIFGRDWEFWPDHRPNNRDDAGINIGAATASPTLEDSASRIRDFFENNLNRGFFMVTSPNRKIRHCFRFVDDQWQEVEWDIERKKIKNRIRAQN